MSMAAAVTDVALPAAPAFDFGDGADAVSAAHPSGVAATLSPPAFTRSTTPLLPVPAVDDVCVLVGVVVDAVVEVEVDEVVPVVTISTALMAGFSYTCPK